LNPKFSILIPVWNGALHLEACLASVLGQTETDFEVLVSDDGSRDGSDRLVQSFQDPRLKLFRGPQRGLFANLNFLLDQAQGEYVRVLCQDDRLSARCLARERAFFERHPFVNLTFCKASRMNSEGTILSTPDLSDLPEILNPELGQQHFFYHGCIAGNLSTVCWKRKLVADFGKFDEDFAVSGDYEYWARLAEKEYIGVIQEALVDLRVHSGQLSRQSQSLPLFVAENRRIRNRVLEFLPISVRNQARAFESRRHDVMDLHSGLRAVVDGNLAVGLSVLTSFTPVRLLSATLHWAVTGNNRWYRPQAPWVLSCPWTPPLSRSDKSKLAA
jgi:glycosyltransferase involved in cell wall biosynthesis